MTVLQDMNYENVTIQTGKCFEQVQENTRFLLNLDEDSMLHLFRKGAGLEAPGTTYCGWYGQGATTFGQWIGAMAKLYQATGDTRLRAKMIRCLEEWAQCIGEEGYTNFSPENASTYGFEKMVGALADAFAYASYAPAMDLLETITAWADRHFDETIDRGYAMYADLASRYMHEWYTLSENYYRAYRLSGRESFLSMAKKWEYTRFWRDMADGNDSLPPLHAYSHVNSLCGSAQKYLFTKEPSDLKVIISAYRVLTQRHLFATGGFGPSEALFGKPGYLGDSLLSANELGVVETRFEDLEGGNVCNDLWGSCEVSCCAWAVFKLTEYLLTCTGKAEYAQWAESMIINGVMAQLPLTDDGNAEYYANYFRYGANKDVEDRRISNAGVAHAWQCCTGTFPQAVAAYHNLIYYHRESSIYISQYIPSEGLFQLEEGGVRLVISGEYPMSEEMTVHVEPSQASMRFSLFVRIPVWAHGAVVKVNHKSVAEIPVSGEWFELIRDWHPGDIVTLWFPFRLRFVPVDEQHPHLAALCYGPLVLASDQLMTLVGDIQHPEAWILPRRGKDCVFETLPGHDQAYEHRTHVFRPFFGIGARSWYYMYTKILPGPTEA